ncbi:AI-2E family transporter [Autumnicola psychrophila]|uniref:AI-2E family transporter n=1 Tax=Autumnicola psychrophila TaxID=3075592 RepID=A0ABU3DWH7_9FLAO|nr:AI-2E family transporter [Zunongwangia sp. F225]MDT0688045.1 AI-2E family transporter [Zunongwangia sp. F225]
MQRNSPSTQEKGFSFRKKVWTVVGILTFTILLILLIIEAANALLLIFAGSLIAIFFTGLSFLLERKTGWKRWLCKTISIISTFIIILLFFWLIGAKIQAQISVLSETIPSTVQNLKEQLNNSRVGEEVVERLTSEESIKKAEAFGGRFFQSTFGVFGDIYVVLFIGIFFTVSPDLYANGAVVLFPPRKHKKVQNVLNHLKKQLRNWLKGKLLSMFVVFAFTAIGLSILGIELWLVLSLLAGLLSFIPNFGPLIALIPAILIGLLQGPRTALIILGIYVLVQFLESNFITPMVQKKMIEMPPALILISQLFMGALTGGWGLILATPITVIVIVLVQDLYLKERED